MAHNNNVPNFFNDQFGGFLAWQNAQTNNIDSDIFIIEPPPPVKTLQECVYLMQMDRYKIFKEQDEERGHFDMALEVGEKKLYVHKYFLATASTTFNSMLSTRWNTSNDQVITIENPDYSYDNIFQLISFIYSCQCSITAENVFVLTDMSEYYGIPLLKEKCCEFLCKMDITFEHLENMVIVATRYSLDKFVTILKRHVKSSMRALIESEHLLSYKKPLIEFMSVVEKSDTMEEEFFDAICQWALHQTTIKAEEWEGVGMFDFDGCLKAELKGLLCHIKFSKMTLKFIKESVVKKRSIFAPKQLYHIIEQSKRNHDQEEECFQALYQFAHGVAKENKSTAVNDKSIRKMIKSELADILPKLKYHRMSIKFLMDFIVDFGVLLPFYRVYACLVICRSIKKEEALKAVYLLAEKHALRRQPFLDPLKLHDAVKKELVDVLKRVKLHEMDVNFWMNFAINKGFSMSSSDFYAYFVRLTMKYHSEALFKVTYDLAEMLVLKKQELSKTTYFNIYESVKNQMVNILPFFQFHKMDFAFLMDYVVGKGLLLSTTMIRDFFLKARNDYVNEQLAFKAVYRLAEKQAMEEQQGSGDKSFNLINATKNELVETIPIVGFNKMNKKFIFEFVVPKRILTVNEAKELFYARIEVQSDNTTITGIFDDIYGIMKAIPANGYFVTPIQWNKLRFSQLKFKIPTIRNTVSKMKGCEWYLCLEKDGVLCVKFCTLISSSDYLIAEMKATSDFMFDTAQAACLKAGNNTV